MRKYVIYIYMLLMKVNVFNYVCVKRRRNINRQCMAARK